jgi:tRNA dimethylallyltransferase
MISNGLIEEVKSLKKYEKSSRVLNSAIGYKEILMYLNQDISKEEAIDLIKKNSRHYAKRQYTWFNNKMNITWFNVNIEDFSKTIAKIEDFLDHI